MVADWAFDSRAGGQATVYIVDPDGGVPRRLSKKGNGYSLPTWSCDGNVLYVSATDGENGEIYKIPLEGGAPQRIATATEFIGNVKESEDGKWLYYAKGEPNSEIRVVTSKGGEDYAVAGMPRVIAMTDWAMGKDGIFFLDRRELSTRIKIFELGTRQIRQIAVLNKPANNWGGLSLSPDGQWLAYSQVDDTPADIMLVENFN
jgi:Tol biopolymer transport system component